MGDLPSSCSQFSWLSFVGIILLQGISGTRSIVTAYSFLMERHACSSQVQLNNLITALDIGRLFGWFSNTAAEHLPLAVTLLIGLVFGSIGYGAQYLYLIDKISSLSYWHVFLLNIIAGYSLWWIDTYCTLVVVRNFKENQKTIISLTNSYSVLSGKIYTTLVEGIRGRRSSGNSSTYLLLSCLVPSMVGLPVAFLFSFPKLLELGELETFPMVFLSAAATGIYAFSESITPPLKHIGPALKALILLLAIVLPLPAPQAIRISWVMLKKCLYWAMPSISSATNSKRISKMLDINCVDGKGMYCDKAEFSVKDCKENKAVKLGDEHGIKELLTSVDFWLYFVANTSTVTLVTVYETNLAQISYSRGKYEVSFLLALSSTCGFFGRVFSVSFDWYTRGKHMSSRTALISIMMIPMPVSFFLLVCEDHTCLYISTCILGTCSGVVSAISASTTSDLFGHGNIAVNHNITLANIPIGTLIFGYMAAVNYDKEGGGRNVCIGYNCHRRTFIGWGTISLVGTILSYILHLQTRIGDII